MAIVERQTKDILLIYSNRTSSTPIVIIEMLRNMEKIKYTSNNLLLNVDYISCRHNPEANKMILKFYNNNLYIGETVINNISKASYDIVHDFIGLNYLEKRITKF